MKRGWREGARAAKPAPEKPFGPPDPWAVVRGRLALSVPEVAKLLGISASAVRLMIARGQLPGRKVGGGTERVTHIVPTAGLLAWLDGTSRATREEEGT